MDELSARECAKCHEVKPLEDFPRDRSRPSGVFCYCRQCNTNHMRDYYHKNKDQIAVNRHRITQQRRENYALVRARAVEIYGGCCVACGSTVRMELDHVNEDGADHRERESASLLYHRIARTGARITDYDLQLLCHLCHSAKTWENRRSQARKAA